MLRACAFVLCAPSDRDAARLTHRADTARHGWTGRLFSQGDHRSESFLNNIYTPQRVPAMFHSVALH